MNKNKWKGRECIHKATGHIGRVISTLDATKDFPAQYGIYWYSGEEGKEHAIRIKNLGLLSYWNDKDKIEII